jgi:hypothetical protein
MAVMAQTSSSTPTTTPPTRPGTANPRTAPNGTFKSNEDATHGKGEAAQQEADEDTGKGHGGGMHKPNEDPAHEKGESAAREAQEMRDRRPARRRRPRTNRA